ncbi:MAG: response regulator transcription factor, partial [Thermoanaerobacterales bacterium]|nr:response regulator transcription factor [Thermoanaerobacterales bacterium]
MSDISLVLADDHVLVRKGLRKILEMEKDFKVVGEASDGEEALEQVKKTKPDVLLLDINMPKMNGLEVVKTLKRDGCSTKIIILTVYDDREYLLELIRVGIAGYILKDIEPHNLIEAVRYVKSGETYIQPTLSKALISEYNRMMQPVSGSAKHLTPREKEVLAFISEGMSNAEISESLG